MNPFAAQLDNIRRLSEHTKRNLQQQFPDNKTEPVADPRLAGPNKLLDLARQTHILYGLAVESIPSSNWYRVQPDGLNIMLPCCLGSATSLTPVGAKDLTQLSTPCPVYFLWHPANYYGVILCVEPSPASDPRGGQGDQVSQQSRCSVQVDAAHSALLTLPNGGGIINWSTNRPADACAGDTGTMGATGVGIFQDDWMAFLRADENCGVWAFYIDAMLRLASLNLQIQSAGMNLESLQDYGEACIEQGTTPYPWEALGVFKYGTKIYQALTAQRAQLDEPHYSALEPIYDDQQPFHRLQRYAGYLGQAFQEYLLAPPTIDLGGDSGSGSGSGSGAGKVNRFRDTTVFPGLYAQCLALTGAWSVRSAKRITLAKTIIIPTPKRIQRPESLTGDTSLNYKAAGLFGAGRPHIVTDILDPQGTHPTLERAAGVLDEQTYAWNWEIPHVFAYHQLDFNLPAETDVQAAIGLSPSEQKIPFANLLTGTYIDAPVGTFLSIDHNYNTATYYPNRSYLDMLDDGGVLLGDGFGTEIRATAGSLYITAPGDIILQAGRRVIEKAGMDIILQAHNCLDASVTHGDIRLGAWKNFHALCGNSGIGGFLFESKAAASDFRGWEDRVGTDVLSTGFTIKAPNSAFVALVDEIYLRTGIPTGAEPDCTRATIPVGHGITLDSGQGGGRIITISDTYERYLESGAFDYFGDPANTFGHPISANAYTAYCTSLGGQLCVSSDVVLSSNLVVYACIVSATGHIATAQADAHHNKVDQLTDRGTAGALDAVIGCITADHVAFANGINTYSDWFTLNYYGVHAPGETCTITAVTFSWRTTFQCHSEDFVFMETRYQQLGRLQGSNLSVWIEQGTGKPGAIETAKTFPFPGTTRLIIDDDGYLRQDLDFYDVVAAVSKARSVLETATDLLEPAACTLQGCYTILDPVNDDGPSSLHCSCT